MTTNEIKAIIAEKIAGQGNQVDIGNGLAEVLNALADSIPEGGGGVSPIQLPADTNLSSLPEEYFNQILANLRAGCSVVMVGTSPLTIFISNDGMMGYFGNYDEPITVSMVGTEE